MSKSSTSAASDGAPKQRTDLRELADELKTAQAEIARLTSELSDLQLLYEGTIEHGEAVEDQLAESNILLQETQARLAGELGDASRYVKSIVPAPRRTHPETDWLLIPSTELGGDSFGYHNIDEDHFAVYLLDVCGHGVGAALLSVTVINVLRASALPNADFRDPSVVLSALNDAFPMERQNDMFFTIWYGVYQRSTGILAYASGGHPPAIHIRRDADGMPVATPLGGAEGMAIGAFEGMPYRSARTSIEPGDRLVVVSDGTYEIDAGDGTMLSFEDFVAFVRSRPAGDLESVLAWVHGLNGEGALPDDFSLLEVRF